MFRSYASRVVLTRVAICCVLGIVTCELVRSAPQVSFAYDAGRPLDVGRKLAVTRDGYTEQALTFASPVQGRVPAALFVPSDKPQGRRPAVIFLHGLPGDLNTMTPLAAAYARAGWVGIALSAPYSRPDLPYRRDLARLLPAPLFDKHDQLEVIQAVQDIRRAIDVLVAHPQVDAKRIGVVGFSYGGALAILAAVADPRIAAVSLMAPSSGLASWMRHTTDTHIAKLAFHELPAADQAAWLQLMDTVDAGDWLRRLPRALPIFIQAGRTDQALPLADLNRLIDAAGSRASVKWYDSGHALVPSSQLDQAAFLEQHFGVRLRDFKPTAQPLR